MLDDFVERIENGELANEPAVLGNIRFLLGSVLSDRGEYEQAVHCLENAIPFMEEEIGPNHLETIRAIRALHTCYVATGRDKKSRDLLEKWIERTENNPEIGSRQRILAITSLVSVYSKEKKFAEAKRILNQAQAIAESPADHFDITYLQGKLLCDQGRFEEAIPFGKKAVEMAAELEGENSGTALLTKSFLVWVYRKLERHDEACELLEKLLPAQRALRDPGDALLINSVFVYADSRFKLKQFELALPLYTEYNELAKSASTWRRLMTPMKAQLYRCICFYELERYDEAIELLKKCYAHFHELEGPDGSLSVKCIELARNIAKRSGRVGIEEEILNVIVKN